MRFKIISLGLILIFCDKLFGVGLSICKQECVVDIESSKKTVVINNSASLAKQFIYNNAIYVIDSNINLNQRAVVIPENCVLQFDQGCFSNGIVVLNNTVIEGTDFIFDNVVVKGKSTNKQCYSDWFATDKKGEIEQTKQIQNLFEIANDEVVFSEGLYKFAEIYINFSATIKGKGDVIIKPVLKWPNESFALKNVFTIKEQGHFVIDSISIVGEMPEVYKRDNDHVGDGLINCFKVDSVAFNGVLIKNTVSGYPQGDTYLSSLFQLINCKDCYTVYINNCDFSNNYAYEWINISMVDEKREDLNVSFTNNYIHDYDKGATVLFALCNNLVINNNRFERCYYTGSLLNAYGTHTIFSNNYIRNCRMSSILDTTEDALIWSESVRAENNDIECENATFVSTMATNIILRNNKCKCFNAIKALGYYRDEKEIKEHPEYIKTIEDYCENVVIEGNEFDFTFYNKRKGELPTMAYISGICITPVYRIGNKLTIQNNKFKFNPDVFIKSHASYPRKYLQITNMRDVIIKKNYFEGFVNDSNNVICNELVSLSMLSSKNSKYLQPVNTCNRFVFEGNIVNSVSDIDLLCFKVTNLPKGTINNLVVKKNALSAKVFIKMNENKINQKSIRNKNIIFK